MDANDCRQRLEEGCSLDELISELKNHGHSKIQSIFMLSKVCEKELGDLKIVVHNSPAWSEQKLRDERFHDLLIDEVSIRDE